MMRFLAVLMVSGLASFGAADGGLFSDDFGFWTSFLGSSPQPCDGKTSSPHSTPPGFLPEQGVGASQQAARRDALAKLMNALEDLSNVRCEDTCVECQPVADLDDNQLVILNGPMTAGGQYTAVAIYNGSYMVFCSECR